MCMRFQYHNNLALQVCLTNHPHSNILENFSTPSAILDIHFLTHVPSSNFGVATSTGAFAIYELASWERNPKITHIKTIQYFPENILITAFAWHPESFMVGMSLSDGRVCLGVIDSENETDDSPAHMDIATHDLEAWTLAFLPDGSGILSGGDDSALKMIELSDGPEEVSAHQSSYTAARYMSWSDKKIHGAGVTAILPLHVDDESGLVVTGSYDDHIRLLRVSAAGVRKVLADSNLGGGVWRLKLLDRNPTLPAHHGVEKWRSEPPPTALLLLVSCMHAGTRIVKLSKNTDNEWQFEVLAKFEQHKSMNYGSDSQPAVNGKGQRTFITTSFYDRLLCLWRV
jgi:diphthamide biosynthesis protein 7